MTIFRFSRFAALAFVLASAASAHADQFNFRFSPLGLLVGTANLALDYKLSDQWSVGPQITYTDLKVGTFGSLSDFSIRGTGFAVEGVYSFSASFQDGWYANASIGSNNVELKARNRSTGETLSANGSGMNLQAGGGYKWFWQSFNMNLGLTLARSSVSEIEIRDSNGVVTESYNPRLGVGIDFRMGFTF